MNALEFFYQNPPKLGNFITRKQNIEYKKTIISGSPFSGKTTLAIDFLYKFERFLYVDLNDLRLWNDEILVRIDEFVEKNKIEAICIDGMKKEMDFKCENIVLISEFKDLRIQGYANLELNGLDYEEFIAFYGKNYNQMTLYSHFLAIGNSPGSALGVQNYLKTALRARFSDLELRILSKISSEISQTFNAFKIYKELKLEMKLSKDKFYETMEKLRLKGAIDYLQNLNSKAKFARIYFGDFALKYALNFEKDPSLVISNMAFCELKKLGESMFFTQEADFFIPNLKQVIIVAPFLAPEFAVLRIKRQIRRYIEMDAFHVIVISNANDENTAFEGVKISVTPFWRWAAGISV